MWYNSIIQRFASVRQPHYPMLLKAKDAIGQDAKNLVYVTYFFVVRASQFFSVPGENRTLIS